MVWRERDDLSRLRPRQAIEGSLEVLGWRWMEALATGLLNIDFNRCLLSLYRGNERCARSCDLLELEATDRI